MGAEGGCFTVISLGTVLDGARWGLATSLPGWRFVGLRASESDKASGVSRDLQPSGPAAQQKVSIWDGFKTVFTTPTALMVTLGFCGFIFVITGYMTWVPAYLQEEFGQNQEMAGLHSMLWTYIAAFIGVLLAGTLSDKVGARDHKTRM